MGLFILKLKILIKFKLINGNDIMNRTIKQQINILVYFTNTVSNLYISKYISSGM